MRRCVDPREGEPSLPAFAAFRTLRSVTVVGVDSVRLRRRPAVRFGHASGVPRPLALVDDDGVLIPSFTRSVATFTPRLGPRLHPRLAEPKVVKNRFHIDLKAGGRDQPQEVRWPRVTETVERLVKAGATVIREDVVDGIPDHVVMADPEGNEFCVV